MGNRNKNKGFGDFEMRMGLYGPRAPVIGQACTYTVRGYPEDTVSLVIECHVSNGGIMRLYPRGRREMTFPVRYSQPLATILSAIARNKGLRTIGFANAKINPCRPADAAAEDDASTATYNLDDPAIGDIPEMGVIKPPVALLDAVSAPAMPQDIIPQKPAMPSAPSAMESGPPGSSQFASDMQARTNALLDRLKKR